MTASTDLPFWKPPPPERRDLRRFGLLFCVLSAALAGYVVWRRGLDAATVPAAISAVLLLLSLALPSLLKPAWWPWMVVARVLGFVNSHLLLGAVFYLMFTPIGLVMRLLGHDPLGDRDFGRARRIVTEGGSLWQRREKAQLPLHHYERQF
jgi:hypothetical protein